MSDRLRAMADMVPIKHLRQVDDRVVYLTGVEMGIELGLAHPEFAELFAKEYPEGARKGLPSAARAVVQAVLAARSEGGA